MTYISGSISNNPQYVSQFKKAENLLKGMGYEVFNPAAHFREDWSWNDYMKRDLRILLECDSIVFLKGWEQSKGAKLEHRIAADLGIKTLELREL